MEHRNAGGYALVGALALACGFTMGYVADNSKGPAGVPSDGGDLVSTTKESPLDSEDIRKICDEMGIDVDGSATASEEPKEITIRIVVDDERDGRSSHGGSLAEVVPVPGSRTDDADDPIDDSSETFSKTNDSIGKALRTFEELDARELPTESTVVPSHPKDLSDAQRKRLGEILGKRMGGTATISKVSYGDWDGGDGSRLDITGYADATEFESGDSLSNAFGKAVADLAKESTRIFDDVDLLSVRVFGVEDAEGSSKKGVIPSLAGAEWIASANVDVPSADGKSVGDVNRASVTYQGKPVEIDLGKFGFSSLPPEE